MTDALRDSEALYESLVRNLPQNIIRKDPEGRLTFVNQRYCEWMGKSPEDLIGKTDYDLFPPDLAEQYRQDDLRIMKSGETFGTEEEHILPDGKKLYVRVVKTPLYNFQSDLIGIQGIFWDVTERRELRESIQRKNEELKRLSITDPLTGVYNRLYLDREFRILLNALSRSKGRVSILMLDIDNFKKINDLQGHAAGDEALRSCVKRIQGALRRKSDLLIRLGGDEFLVALFENESARESPEAARVAENLLEAVREIGIKVSVGIAVGEEKELAEEGCLESLLRRVDVALYAAKSQGGNRAVRYSPDLEK